MKCCCCNRFDGFGSSVLSRNAAPPNVVEMSVHNQNFQHLLDKAQGYLTRVQALTVAAGSEMDHDDQYLTPIRRSFQETPMQLLGSAADHLRLVGMSGANQPELNPFASATLVRSAITSAATSLWVLHGEQKIRRIHMLEVLAHDSASYRTFITNTRAMHTTDEATTEVNKELGSMDRRDQWIITEYNALAGPTVKNKATIKQITGAVSDTEMVRTAGDMLGSVLATRGLSSGQEVLAMWQRLSGYAHGRPWAYLPNKTSTGPADASGLERVRIDGDPMFIIGGAAAAMELIEESFRLLDALVA